MEVTWYGANCVALREEGITVLYDPFQLDTNFSGQASLLEGSSSPPALRSPGFDVDILVSSQHHTQKAFDSLQEETLVVSVPGQFESSGIFIHSLPCDSAKTQTDPPGSSTVDSAHPGNLLHFLDFGQTGVMHMGHPGANFRSSDKRLVEDLIAHKTDILILPMGTGEERDLDWALKLSKKLDPRICIPVLYDPEAVGEIATGLQSLGTMNEEAQKRYRATRKDASSENSAVVLLTVSPIEKP